jgi:hypothetical protein
VKGAHGTSIARAEKIAKNGGFIPNSGLRGTGTYFWAESHYSRQLAIAWWQKLLSDNRFRGDNDTRCAVIYALIRVPQNNYLNFEESYIKKRLSELISKKRIDNNKEKISALYDFFISSLEKQSGEKIYAFEVAVNPPPRCTFYPQRVLGDPICIVVRASRCIEIESIERNAKYYSLFHMTSY